MKLILADLRHATVGTHSAYMPIAIGYIASYAQSVFGSSLAINLITKPNLLTEGLQSSQPPDVLGLSNYCWNAELSRFMGRYAKKIVPNVVIVAGGPEFPTNNEEAADYLAYRSEIDFFVHNYEGEATFLEILKRIQANESLASIKASPPLGVACLNEDGALIRTAAPERFKDLDLIPSPILSGMMDGFLDGSYMPFLETTRGCPYGCTFCVQSNGWYNKIYGFSTERIETELRYIAERMGPHVDVPLGISDSNFGMYPRDLETAKFLAKLSKEYEWPRSFIVDTGKAQAERLIEVALTLGRRMSMSLSPQSLNDATLTAISRTNLGGKKNRKSVYKQFKDNGISSNAAIIVPLPEETKESFITGLRALSDSHVDQPLAYTTMLLKGTPLASKESRNLYKMETRYRLLPRQFGKYMGERVVEYDEVCVATNTMSYEEYLECRGFSLIFLALSSKQYNFLRPVCEKLGVDWFDLLLQVWQAMKEDRGSLGRLYREFITASEEELFDSPEELVGFVQKDANYKRLLSGEIGETIMRNFVPRMIINHFEETVTLTISLLEGIKPDQSWLLDVQAWVIATRNIDTLLDGMDKSTNESKIILNWNVEDWLSGSSNHKLEEYRPAKKFVVVSGDDGIYIARDAMIRLYGSDRLRWVSRLLEAKPLEEMWMKTVLDTSNEAVRS